ncbi:MAG: chromosome segregation protein SMC [Bacteroidales bacterium]|nr:chromosome segregation protein SMC [Bacteroidales bacterium]
MHLEKLKIFGFKSFAKKTTLDLIPGITAIVGPNGCGKSNIVDALRWVLGEQKAGTLRSDRMESVIFNGTKDHKPLGMAEVSLVIQNSDNTLPVEYSEVVITRRLFRSGESQYLLNNNPCRLKDINDLLMDTGLAPDAYSVIELSMVEQILNGKPEDRRRIFEEAVGLTKYKQRRKLTFRKLDATEQDLIRIADIIGEVKSKVNSLHRQVRRAQRYQTLSKNLSEAEIRMGTNKFSQIYEELGPLNEKFEESNRGRESLSSQISFKEAEVESIQADLLQHEDQLRKNQGRLNQIKETIHKREEEILLSRERLKSLAENKARIQTEMEDLASRISVRKEQLVSTQEQKSSTSAEIDKLRQEYETEKQALDKLEQLINESRTESRTAEQKAITLMETISEKQRVGERVNAQLETFNQRSQSLAEDKNNSLSKIEEETQYRKKLQQTYQQQLAELEELIGKQAELELQSERIQQEVDQLKNTILQKNNQIESTQQRIAFLKDLLESYADYPEGVKHMMVNHGSDKGFQGAFADMLTVKNEYRKAIEAALGDSAAYLVVDDSETAYVGVNTLTENQQGIVTFLPIDHLSPTKQQKQLPSESGIIGWADKLINCDNKFLPAANVLLGAYLIVEDLAVAKKVATQFSEQLVHVVTKSGEIVYNWGGIKGGKKETDSESIIGRQDQLENLSAQLDTFHQELTDAEKN